MNAIYETGGFLIYLPSAGSPVVGVFVVLYGTGGDSRPLIRGNLAFYQEIPPAGDVAAYRSRMMALARTHGLALMGTTVPSDGQSQSTYANILNALVSFSAVSGRSELAQTPLLFHGHSLGSCMGYDFAVLHSSRVIAFITSKCASHSLDGSPAVTVPGYWFIGAVDPVHTGAAANMTSVFEQNRARGAVWTLAIEPGGAGATIADQDLLFNWMTAVITRRLPATVAPGEPVALRPVEEPSGWLGDRATFTIAEYACYNDNRLQASWLPSEQTARDWQAMVSSRFVTTVTAC